MYMMFRVNHSRRLALTPAINNLCTLAWVNYSGPFQACHCIACKERKITPSSLPPRSLYKNSPESEILDRKGHQGVVHPGAAVGKDIHVQSWALHAGQIHGSADGALRGEEGLISQTARKKGKKEELTWGGGGQSKKESMARSTFF